MRRIYTASVTPFDESNQIKPGALLDLMAHNLEEGVSGFFIGGSSAECFLLSPEERIQCFEIASAFKERTELIAHVGAIGTDEAIRYARAAKRLGFHRISATLPYYYRFSNGQVVSYYQDISRAVDMPVLIYNFPQNTGRELDLKDPQIAGLLKSEVIWGIKHTHLNVYQMERIKNFNPRLKVYDGFDETLLAGLALGVDGAIGSTFNFMVPHYQRIVALFEARQMEAALDYQIKANKIMESLCDVGLIAAIKYILALQGYPVGEPRRPFHPVSEAQKQLIREVLEKNLWQKQ